MSSTAVLRSNRAAIAVGLLLVGFLSLGLWRVVSGSEHQAFAKGATPPTASKVTEGKTYSLAVPGGVPALLSHGISQISGANGNQPALTCQWSIGGSASQSLVVSPESVGTKAETTVASFTAPASGEIAVSCDGWGRMFIPDAESGSSDPSGYFLLLSMITLTIGGSLALSVGYSRRQSGSAHPRAGGSRTESDGSHLDGAEHALEASFAGEGPAEDEAPPT
jgi:hypothetical protein